MIELKLSPREQVQKFLEWMDKAGVSRVDLQMRTPSPHTPGEWMWLTRQHQGIRPDKVLSLWSWLRYMNANGTDVFVRPAREHEHPMIFLDDLSIDKAKRIAEKYGAAVVLTSPDNTQVWLKTDRFLSKSERGQIQKHLSSLGWGDPGSISGDHLGRMCGVRSQKRKCWVNALFFSCAPGLPVERWLAPSHTSNCARPCALSKSLLKNNTPSEKEYGWSLGLLRSNMPDAEVEEKLLVAASHRGKRNPRAYAQRTVNAALKAFERERG